MILFTTDELVAYVANQRADNLTIAWTNGCFDILHPGHLETF